MDDVPLSDENLKLAVRLELDEVGAFRDLFELAAGRGQNVLHGMPAKAFFSRSGLPNATLKTIWAMCDRGKKGHLTRPEFVLAARLVALAQIGLRCTLEQLQTFKGRFPVPKFELPENIYADDFDVTEAERATKHEYDPTTKQWRRTMINVIIDKKPFAEGAMRAAYHMRDLSTVGQQSMYVAKLAKVPGTPVSQYFEDVKMQTEAGKYAEEFNKRNVPKPIEFIAAYVIELIDRTDRPMCGVERYVPGEYVKYNNNWDWSDDRRNTPQAFSHFTWEASNHTLLICDIQGTVVARPHPALAAAPAGGRLDVAGGGRPDGMVRGGNKVPAAVGGPRGGAGGGGMRTLAQVRLELQGQFQQQLVELQKRAAAAAEGKLEAERRRLREQHVQVLAEERKALDARRREDDAARARWLEEQRRRLADMMDKRLEEERRRIEREALADMLLPAPHRPLPPPAQPPARPAPAIPSPAVTGQVVAGAAVQAALVGAPGPLVSLPAERAPVPFPAQQLLMPPPPRPPEGVVPAGGGRSPGLGGLPLADGHQGRGKEGAGRGILLHLSQPRPVSADHVTGPGAGRGSPLSVGSAGADRKAAAADRWSWEGPQRAAGDGVAGSSGGSDDGGVVVGGVPAGWTTFDDPSTAIGPPPNPLFPPPPAGAVSHGQPLQGTVGGNHHGGASVGAEGQVGAGRGHVHRHSDGDTLGGSRRVGRWMSSGNVTEADGTGLVRSLLEKASIELDSLSRSNP